MLETVQEIAIYIHRWYQIKVTMRWEDSSYTSPGTPARVVQYEAPDLGDDDIFGVWRIDDTDNSFSTQPFRIKYARQDVLLSVMIAFNISLGKYEGPSTSAVILKFELMYAPILENGSELQDSLDAFPAAVHEFRIPPKALLGLHSYCPVHFDTFHAVLVELSVHIILLKAGTYTPSLKVHSIPVTAPGPSNENGTRGQLIGDSVDRLEVVNQSRGAGLGCNGSGGVGVEEVQTKDFKKQDSRNLELQAKGNQKRKKSKKKNQLRTVRRRNLKMWRKKALIEGSSIQPRGGSRQPFPSPSVETFIVGQVVGQDPMDSSSEVVVNPEELLPLAQNNGPNNILNLVAEKPPELSISGLKLLRELGLPEVPLLSSGLNPLDPFGLDSIINGSRSRKYKRSGQGLVSNSGLQDHSDGSCLRISPVSPSAPLLYQSPLRVIRDGDQVVGSNIILGPSVAKAVDSITIEPIGAVRSRGVGEASPSLSDDPFELDPITPKSIQLRQADRSPKFGSLVLGNLDDEQGTLKGVLGEPSSAASSSLGASSPRPLVRVLPLSALPSALANPPWKSSAPPAAWGSTSSGGVVNSRQEEVQVWSQEDKQMSRKDSVLSPGRQLRREGDNPGLAGCFLANQDSAGLGSFVSLGLGQGASMVSKQINLIKALLAARDILLEELQMLSEMIDQTIDLTDFTPKLDEEKFSSFLRASLGITDAEVSEVRIGAGQVAGEPQNGFEKPNGTVNFESEGLLQSLSEDDLLNIFHSLGNQLFHLWNAFLKFHRANKTQILEFLRDAWANDRRAEWSIWMLYSKVQMPHHYLSTGVDESSHHSLRGKVSISWNLTEDPAQTAITRAELHRRSIAQMRINSRSIQDMHIFGDPLRVPVIIVERVVNAPLHTNSGNSYFSPLDASSLLMGPDVKVVNKLSGAGPQRVGRVLKIVVFVHGFQGHHLDLRLVRNQWLLIDPGVEFLMSEVNEDKTSGDFREMGLRLAQEVTSFLRKKIDKVSRSGSLRNIKLSFVGHSIGNVIIRTALAAKDIGKLQEYNSVIFTPDCDSCSLTLMSQDGYVPYHSARIELCQASSWDYSKKGVVFLEMLNNCLDQIRAPSSEQRMFMRCDVNFDTSSQGRNLNTMIGRAAHIEFLETDIFARFIMWSFPELFR
ncbi:hypothetical protein HHK36_004183 [Tetracentron sinense]|uniref:DUF676 domain-containing protein n=1 Tax=Tetracentron sinense TaxID=13715 RepID=A0A834ZUE5_TETSI|nr:hypothetical protein HHK36_004183 [Tetracentron sinense]